MKKLILASLVFALFAVLQPSTASAQIQCTSCTCADHCNTTCRVGFFTTSTCGAFCGICDGGPECSDSASAGELDLEAIELDSELDSNIDEEAMSPAAVPVATEPEPAFSFE